MLLTHQWVGVDSKNKKMYKNCVVTSRTGVLVLTPRGPRPDCRSLQRCCCCGGERLSGPSSQMRIVRRMMIKKMRMILMPNPFSLISCCSHRDATLETWPFLG